MYSNGEREKQSYQHHGLTVYKIGNQEWAVGDDTVKDDKGRTRVDRAARRAVIDSLWAFNAEFIVGFLTRHRKFFRNMSDRASEQFERTLKKLQGELCEDAQPIIRALIGSHLDGFVKEAVQADGRGHFLSGYDRQECDSDDVEGLPRGKVAFRLN